MYGRGGSLVVDGEEAAGARTQDTSESGQKRDLTRAYINALVKLILARKKREREIMYFKDTLQ